MARNFPWKRFWCRRDASYTLGDRGFLIDPDADHGAALNPNLLTLDQLQEVPCLALLGEPGIGKSWSLRADVNAFLQQSSNLEVIRLDLRSFGSEDRLYRSLFENPTFLRWVDGDYELHLYLDSFDECLLRIDTVASLIADFGGHREEVLARDGYRCAVPGCTTLKRGKRSVEVHHRMPGKSDPKLMITLCLPCHAKVSRTRYLRQAWPSLLRVLWREQHPKGHEQTGLDFLEKKPPVKLIPLFPEEARIGECKDLP